MADHDIEQQFSGSCLRCNVESAADVLMTALGQHIGGYERTELIGLERILAETKRGGRHRHMVSLWPGKAFTLLAANLEDGWKSLGIGIGKRTGCE